MAAVRSLLLLSLVACGIAATANAQCISVTLPNILGLGECLGTTLQNCPLQQLDDELPVLPLIECLLTGLSDTLNPIPLLYNLGNVLEAVLEGLGISVGLQPVLERLCSPLGTQSLSCRTVGIREVCQTPITVQLPSALNAGACLNRSLVLCQQGTRVNQTILEGLVGAVNCLLTGERPEGVQEDALRRVACMLEDALRDLVGETLVLLPFQDSPRSPTRLVMGLIDRLSSQLPNCDVQVSDIEEL